MTALGKQLCMHVAAADPVPAALSEADLDPALIEKERTILVEQARESGRPEEIIAKMVEGRLAKFKKELCLMDQGFCGRWGEQNCRCHGQGHQRYGR